MSRSFKPSHRGATPSIAEEMHRRAGAVEAKGQKVLYLSVGQPSTPAPAGAMAAFQKASNESIMGYTGAAGIEPLRQRIARHYQENYGVAIAPNRVLITLGASGALILALISCFDSGARVALPQPFYFAYRHVMSTLGIECVPFYPSMENHFQPTVADLEKIEGRIDGLIFASPGNPTGSMIKPDQMGEIAQYCETRGIRLISDEIYHGIIYGDKTQQRTALSYAPHAVVMNSFSKYYSMPGWRLGWMVAPENLVEPIANLAHNLYIAPPAPAQYAALAALDCTDELDGHVARYRRNRDIMLREMPKAGFDRFTAPDGGFYLFCHVAHLHKDSVRFCIDMLEECGVLAAPGTDFSPAHGHHFVRFSYAGSTQEIEDAMARLKKWRAV